MTTIDFPRSIAGLPNRDDGYVYVLSYVLNDVEIPFYVGESGRFGERMQDYEWAEFQCTTDFKVGSAIRYLRDHHGLRVVVRYQQSSSRKDEETALIRDYVLAGYRLLNSLPSYNYKTASQDQERAVIHAFCDMLLGKRADAAHGSS